MLRDAQGLEISTDAPEVIAAVDLFTERFLSLAKSAGILHEALAVDPGCVAVNAYAAAQQLLADRLGGAQRAQPFLDAARSRAANAGTRERALLGAVEAWAAGQLDSAVARFEAVLGEFPRDLVALGLTIILHFKRGDSHALLRICEKVYDANRDSLYMDGLIAFGYSECGRYAEAEAVGRRGIERKPDDLGAQHAVAHVLEMQGRIDEGAAWLEGFSGTWGNATAEMYSHLWWHIAIFNLDRKDPQRILDLFDARVWGDNAQWGPDKGMSRFPINAIHLLWRLQLRGVDVGARWRIVAARVADRSKDPAEAYPALLYLYALSRGESAAAAAEMLLSIEERARSAKPHERRAWQEIALPTAHGLAAHAHGDFEVAARHLTGAGGDAWIELGHSAVQRNIFAVTLQDCITHTH